MYLRFLEFINKVSDGLLRCQITKSTIHISGKKVEFHVTVLLLMTFNCSTLTYSLFLKQFLFVPPRTDSCLCRA